MLTQFVILYHMGKWKPMDIVFLSITTDTQEDAKQTARDIAMYDTRGCMAPVAVLCTGDANLFAERLFKAMREMEQHTPLGLTDPFLGPEVRRRIGLTVQRPNQIWLERSQSRMMAYNTSFGASFVNRTLSLRQVHCLDSHLFITHQH